MAEDTKRPLSERLDSDDKPTFLHIRVDADFKDRLSEYAQKHNVTMTSLVVSTMYDVIHKDEEEEEIDENAEMRELIISALQNLERRMEVRIGTLQDTFNSLIGRLIDYQQQVDASYSTQLTRRKKGTAEEGTTEGTMELGDVLTVDKEEEVYTRVRKVLENKGKVVDLQTVLEQIEGEPMLKKFLDEQESITPGWKDAIITDAIQEAASQLGFRTIDSI